jgi:hypothetical protein
MTHSRHTLVALTAVTMLVAATPAVAGNGGRTSVPGKTLQVEQLGPKHLLGGGTSRSSSSTSATRAIPITLRTLEVEELGPKYLLGR